MQQLQPVRHKMQEILAFNRLEAVQVGLCTGQHGSLEGRVGGEESGGEALLVDQRLG